FNAYGIGDAQRRVIPRREEVRTALEIRAGRVLRPGAGLLAFRVGLQILGRIILQRLAGLGIDALRPGQLGNILGRLDVRAVGAVEVVKDAVPAKVGQNLTILAVDLGVDQQLGADLVIVVIVAGRILEVPLQLAGIGVQRHARIGVEIVAWAIFGVE